jgi:ELWxxDGT repeat protein
LEPLEDRTLLSAFLVKDINTNTAGSNPSNLTNVNGTLFFSATDNSGAVGLWKSDGTLAGTSLVREFSGLENFVTVNGELFFDVFNKSPFGGPVPAQLWKSDGTALGTTLVKDFTGQGVPENAVAFQNRLYFGLTDSTTTTGHLWTSDGTLAGTVPVDPGAFTIGFSGTSFAVLGSQLFFAASDPINGAKLWKTDGTDGGTQIADGDIPNVGVSALTAVNGALYFFAVHDSTFQTVDLFQSDGSHTTLVQTGFSNFGEEAMAGAGGKLFFIAAPASNFFTDELWVSDAGGTRALNPANVSPYGLNPFGLQEVNGRVVFNGSSAAHPFFGEAIWASDGTDAGTVEITPAGLSFVELFNGSTALSGNTLFFGGFGSGGAQVWRTDGTAPGTKLVASIAPGFFAGTTPSFLTVVGGKLFFSANDGAHGTELWVSDGTAAGTNLVKDINTNTIGSFPIQLTDANGTLFFTADSSPTSFSPPPSPELWKSDGSAAGTQLVGKPFSTPGAFPGGLTNVNGTVFFVDINGPPQLWTMSANTGPQLVMDFSQLGQFIFGPDNLTAVGNKLFFTIVDDTGAEELWQSDGTPGGTSMIASNLLIPFGSGVAVGNDFYFVNVDLNTFAFELWVSDGTAAGTHVVDPANPGANVFDLTNINGTLYYFDLGATFNDLTLWKTDGTTATKVADLQPGADFATAFPPINVNGKLDFLVEDFTTGTSELWTSDGTAAGTTPLAILPQPDFTFSSTSGNAVLDAAVIGNRLLFSAKDPIVGDELWVSDGTAGGTKPVAGVTPGTDPFGNPIPFNLTAFNGRAFFAASDASHGTELWESDATAAGTFMVQDINPGPAGSISGFTQLVPSGGALFFDAHDAAHGDELWAYYPATHFQVTTTSNLATPGTQFPMTVSALDRNGNVDTAYTGTVHFTSTDSQAVLPSDYTFLPSDHGFHSFLATLRTPGVQTISISDTATGTIIGQVTLTVPVNVSDLVHVARTSFINRFNGLYLGQIIIQNTSSVTINGPIQIVLFGLDPRIRLLRAGLNGTTPLSIGRTASGDTVITLNVSQFAPDTALRIVVEFSDPFALPIFFSVQTYSDSF